MPTETYAQYLRRQRAEKAAAAQAAAPKRAPRKRAPRKKPAGGTATVTADPEIETDGAAE